MKPSYSNRYLETSNSTASLKTVKPDWSKLEDLDKSQASAGKPPRIKPDYSSESLRRDGIKAGIEVTTRPVKKLKVDDVQGGVDEALEKVGIKYRDPAFESQILLPLFAYDDKTLVFRHPEEWQECCFPLKAHSLRLNSSGSGSYQPCVVVDYDAQGKKFYLNWMTDLQTGTSSSSSKPPEAKPVAQEPLHVYFEGEDLDLYCKRVSTCHQKRRYAESLLKYNFCIDQMPADKVSTCPQHVLERIGDTACNTSYLKEDRHELDLTTLEKEVSTDYSRAMNKIIFDDVVSQEKEKHLLLDLELPPPPEPEPVPRKGDIGCEGFDFRQSFSVFCKTSLRIRPEVVACLSDVQKECQTVLNRSIFRANYAGTYDANLVKRLDEVDIVHAPQTPDEFLRAESAHIDTMGYLSQKFVPNVRAHVYRHLNAVEQKWFNLYETDRNKYLASRLRCFLEEIDLRIQDTIHTLGVKSLHFFDRLLALYMPDNVVVNSLRDVKVVRRKPLPPTAIALKKPVVLLRLRMVLTFEKKAAGAAAVSARPASKEPGAPRRSSKFRMAGMKISVTEALKKRTSKSQLANRRSSYQLDDGSGQPAEDLKPYSYDVKPESIANMLMHLFDKGVKQLDDISSIQLLVLPHLFESGEGLLKKGFTANDSWVKKLRLQIKVCMEKHLPWLESTIGFFEAFMDTIEVSPEKKIEELETKFKTEGPDSIPVAEVQKLVDQQKTKQNHINESIPDHIVVGFFQIDCVDFKKQLCDKLERLSRLYLKFLADVKLGILLQSATDQFGDMFKKLREPVHNIAELCEQQDYIGGLEAEVKKLEVTVKDNIALCELLETKYGYKLTRDVSDKRWRMFGSPGDVRKLMNEVSDKLVVQREEFLNENMSEQQAYEKLFAKLKTEVAEFTKFDSLGMVDHVAAKTRWISEQFEKSLVDTKEFQAREILFDPTKEPTDYSSLGELIKQFEPYQNLWKTAGDWVENRRAWMNGNFNDIDSKKAEEEVLSGIKLMFKTVRMFQTMESKQKEDMQEWNMEHPDEEFPEAILELSGIISIAEAIKGELEEFKPNLPLIVGLRNPGMRDRHWKQISEMASETTGREVSVSPEMDGFTLEKFLGLGLQSMIEDIESIGDRAGKEFSLEKSLAAMKADWEPVAFDLSGFYRNTGTYILKGADEALALLDEHIVMTQAMQFSIFKKPFEEEIDEWATKLMLVSETLDMWLKVQRSWMYLQPIFDSEDIMKQLPAEGKRFKQVDTQWRRAMNAAHANPKVIEICADETLRDMWMQSNVMLDMVQKGLEDYLEMKRSLFARFYFLSNDELLEILSQTKDPTRVQPFLCKVFEAMGSVIFTEDLDITAMNSTDGETVPFVEPMATKEKNVEQWMTEVEWNMKEAVRAAMEDAVLSYPERDRKDWVLEHPAQTVLNGSQVYWTDETEESFQDNSVKQHCDNLAKQILDLVGLVRGNLTKAQRTSIGALVVLDVHAKDVVEKYVEEGVCDEEAFEWISQLRYYWEHNEDHPGYESSQNRSNLWVKCVQTEFPYGYEYLGNSFRLVITPLTDMCYITLMGAQSLNLGGAPAGPAGTGKTETTKDLAKALAKQCVVFNCSPEMDYIMVGKFFKGLASCGAWCCFDEFNRIYIEVLSVIAQQLLILFGAKSELASYSDAKELDFEGSMIKMFPTFNVFITMNPGYAGRTELPDNLAALFRPMAMMVPDYGLIAEIMLYAFGFDAARLLARKMVYTFKLSSEQLSSQDHYDYGMRAVKTSIEACGLLKKTFRDMDESQIELRALRDVNVPKFLKDDLPLFENIISDLFPDTPRPVVDYGDLFTELEKTCKTVFNLQPTPWFIEKIIQLMDTIRVRHGMMIVGPTWAGKTQNYRVLAHSLTQLAPTTNEDYFKVTNIYIINPKAITQTQLYGAFDEVTHEWSDGIAAEEVRIAVKAGKSGSDDNQWIMFDGPVDALWIESMNTVLDDNKKLCLTSGEIISLTPFMRIQFEVEDLSVASPATVSRCGMVYMEPVALGSMPLVESMKPLFPKLIPDPMRDKFVKLLAAFHTPLIRCIYKKCAEPSTTETNQVVAAFWRLFATFLQDYEITEARTPTDADIEDFGTTIFSNVFVFCCAWGIGGSITAATRPAFSADTWELIEKHSGELEGFSLKKDTSIYDMCYDVEKKKWIKWDDTVPKFQIPPRAEYDKIVVPTTDSIRMMFTASRLLENDRHVLVPGNTGTGKSILMAQYLQKNAPDFILSVFINFSAQTHVNQFQDLLDSKMEKRRRGVYGPAAGKKLVLFVDDLNMPQKEFYGAQPPIELIRMWMDHGGWYNRKELVFLQIIDIVWLSCMGPPGGGKTVITNRLRRHYNTLVAADLSASSIEMIFKTTLGYFLQNFEGGIPTLIDPLVKSSVKVFDMVTETLLPTPAKCHYVFNLRDTWKVFQGVCMLHPKKVTDPISVIKCWIHENFRVFADRFINHEDKNWLKELLSGMLPEIKDKVTPEQIFDKERLVFGDFMIPGADPRFYVEIADMEQMKTVIEGYLDDYNNMASLQMPLVMFTDACEHVSRITRVLGMPSGNALLLGVGGSGRQSLTRLASFTRDFPTFQIEVGKGYGWNEFKEDLRTVLKKCGVQDKTNTFLFCDTQIVKEQFVEAMSNILNSADVPNLYPAEEMDQIVGACKALASQAGLPPTKTNIFNCYVARVKKNLHVVLAFSPLGDAFAKRLLMFPALVNCCTIDWFMEWPAEALYNVAKQQMAGDGAGSVQSKLAGVSMEGVLNTFKVIHQSVEQCALRYFEEVKRKSYVTPTSYLELLNSFSKVLDLKSQEVNTLIHRFQSGLDKLASAEEQVAVMEKELVELQPILEKTSVEVAEMMVVIQRDKKVAEETKEVVDKQAEAAEAQAAEAKEIKDDAQKDLDEALPALDAAVKCLQSLKLSHLQEVKALGSPPAGVKLTMEAMCIMFEYKPKMVADPSGAPGKKVPDYWDVAKTGLLSDPKKLLQDLFDFDKDNIPEKVIKGIQAYIDNEGFQPEAIKKASVACEALCMWCRAMHKYHFVALAVEPKRIKLRGAEEILSKTMGELKQAQDTLQGIMDKLNELESNYNGAVSKQKQLKEDSDMCIVKLERANKLIGGLGGEKTRWIQTVADLRSKLELLPGDCLMTAGALSYLGIFTGVYRDQMTATWSKGLAELKIPRSEKCGIVDVLGEPVKIEQWTVYGLPNDELSVQNAIIIDKSRRWPLMIDPQRQANAYIKQYGKKISEGGFEACKLSDPNFLRVLELGIQFGKWILLENVGEELDAALEPILMQQKVKDGGSYVIKLGDKNVTYMDSFRFFVTTNLSNPHYPPEVSVKVTILNFAITQDGLQGQMLGIVVAKEAPELEEKKSALVKDSADMKKQLKDIEDEILRLLAASGGNILEDETLINTLAQSKQAANVINKKVEEGKITEKEIDVARSGYIPVAFRASILFFCVVELIQIDPMYQFSLQWFQLLFGMSVENAPACKVFEERLEVLKDFFTYNLYNNVCRALFEKHKTMFSLSLALRLLQGDGKMDFTELRFLLTGPTINVDDGIANPDPSWISGVMWNELLTLDRLTPAFAGLAADMAKDPKAWKVLYDTPEAHEVPLPQGWAEKLITFQKLLVLRAIRLDKLVPAITNFITEAIGGKFVEPPTFDIATSYGDSTAFTPLIFVLVTGSDPVGEMLAFAEECGKANMLSSISLGQGQGPKAARMIEEAKGKGGWVLLQNCHLAISWMPELERICEQLNPEEVNQDYRLWLTSMPSPAFPALLLQNGVKMTNEPPAGLKANLMYTFTRLDDKTLDDCRSPSAFKKVMFAYAYFHAIVQERRKFGPIGWNIPYGFTNEDLATCRRQAKHFLDKYEEVPYKVLNYLGAKINYGGRVTDAQDKILASAILSIYICPPLIEKGAGYKFSESGIYYCPDATCQEEFISYIKGLPLMPTPEAFGMHENCNIAYAEDQAQLLLGNILSMAPRSSGGKGASREEVIDGLTENLLSQTPKPFDMEYLEERFPTSYEESTNTVIKQESLKYNRLLRIMLKMLPLLRRALKGLVAMSEDLLSMSNSIYINGVPDMFSAPPAGSVGFLSLMPLSHWTSDLKKRIGFIQSWIDSRIPVILWLSGLFFPQAYFTGSLQNFARKTRTAIDRCSFGFEVIDDREVSDFKTPASEGVYTYGIYLEGGRWNKDVHALDESIPKQLYFTMHPIHMIPMIDRKKPEGCYECPLYKTLARRGTLSTTGHSTNFVINLTLRSREQPEKWTVSGLAGFLALKVVID
ncbi:unnamed protein product [Amoebophrya sp. A25]|nr:unnamed protein product [Amoebophrya sp. A25]|eukprot:GSA25T00015017001.1